MNIVIALFVLACVFVAWPNEWTRFVTFWIAVYFLSEITAYIGGRL